MRNISEYLIHRIKDQIKLYKNQPMTTEKLARIEALEWVLEMIE